VAGAHLGRAADLLGTLGVVSVLPIAVDVLGLLRSSTRADR
jgi:hypothetical protein